MQFKHQELLWALLLLLIPIFIHLFQLRKFKKTPFTNVKFLQKVVSKSRKSSTLKKWLLLAARMLLLAALVIAFAQPFFAKNSALKEKETVIYLDNSFSMQAKSNKQSMLNNAIQELLKYIPKESSFTFFNNDDVYRNVTIKDIQNNLLTTKHSAKQLSLEAIDLKAKTLFSSHKNKVKELIIVSDFQQQMASGTAPTDSTLQKHLVQLQPDNSNNIAIDSVYIRTSSPETIELVALLSSTKTIEDTPVSLFNDDQLIAKTAASFNANKKAEVLFSIPSNAAINGKLQISDGGLAYDNELFFNINLKEKIKVTAISEANDDFLKQLFTEDEFKLELNTLKNIVYSELEYSNLIILNELKNIPTALINALKAFKNNGGSLLIIPSTTIDINSYYELTSRVYSTALGVKIRAEKKITTIAFSHPLYKNVFQKNIANFQYPEVTEHYKVKTIKPSLLSLEDGDSFLVGIDDFYLFTASISNKNSNFKNSPLIVPTLYNIGINSLKIGDLYNLIGEEKTIEIIGKLPKDNILKIKKLEQEFIPIQKSFANKVALNFTENPTENGIYNIVNGATILKNISFNYTKNESNLSYIDIATINAATKQNTVATLFNKMKSDASITQLWKWFIILALLFLLVEVLIQKY